jgi:hypothetical protein
VPRIAARGGARVARQPKPGPPAWSKDQISIALQSPSASCIGVAWPSGRVKLSACQPITGCKPEARFELSHWFHVDSAAPGAPKPDHVVPKQVDVHAEVVTPDDTKVFQKHVTDKAPRYVAPGHPLSTTAGTGFSFKTSRTVKLRIDLQQQVAHSGGVTTVGYSDIVEFRLVDCDKDEEKPKPDEPGNGEPKPKKPKPGDPIA